MRTMFWGSLMSHHDFKKFSIDHAPVKKISILVFFVFILLIILFITFQKTSRKRTGIITPSIELKQEEIKSYEFDQLILHMRKEGYSHWEKKEIVSFIKGCTPILLTESFEKGAPPGAILAIACLESGFGKSYVSRVSGNILSLNAMETEKALPPLQLPVLGHNDYIIDNQRLKKILATGNEIKVVKRPPSLKKDYRPTEIAGGFMDLDYFLYHPEEKEAAWQNNIKDLLYNRISENSSYTAYREAHTFCMRVKTNKSITLLFSNKTSTHFLFLIGGRPQSYNSNFSWRQKTQNLVYSLGLDVFLRNYLMLYKDKFNLTGWKYDL